MSAYLYEFLYRGLPDGTGEYHVQLAAAGTDSFGNATLALSQALTPDQAKAQGFDLPAIVAGINTALMTTNASLTAENAALKATTADPDAPAEPAGPPTSVTRLQGRLALFNAGLLPQVEAAVAVAGGAVAIWYADAQHWVRTDPVFVQLETSLNLSSSQVDALFTAASAIS